MTQTPLGRTFRPKSAGASVRSFGVSAGPWLGFSGRAGREPVHGDNDRSRPVISWLGHGPQRETGNARHCGLLRLIAMTLSRLSEDTGHGQVTAQITVKSRSSHGQVTAQITAGLVGGTAPKFAKDGKRGKPFDFQTGSVAACCGLLLHIATSLLRLSVASLLRLTSASLLRLIAVVCVCARSRSEPTGSLRLRLIAPCWQRAKAFLRLIAASHRDAM